MKPIIEYLSTKVEQTKIKATDETIYKIVRDELDRLGHDASLNHIDVSEVTNMYNLFSCMDDGLGSDYKDLNPDISKWDVSNVENMEYMFIHCIKFNSDISNWDVSNVKTMRYMFWECEQFNCNISEWDVSNVEDMSLMFGKCKKFNQDISWWNVVKVKKNNYMFDGCPIREEFKPKFKI